MVGWMVKKKRKKKDPNKIKAMHEIKTNQAIIQCRCNGHRGWFPSNYVEVVEDIPEFPRPPDKVLPPNPPVLKSYIDSSRSAHSSNSSEVSRNNANLPDGWTIQMSEDGKAWNYYNEYTGQIETEHPSLYQDNDIITEQPEKTNRRSFHSDQSDGFEYQSEVKTSQEVCLFFFL